MKAYFDTTKYRLTVKKNLQLIIFYVVQNKQEITGKQIRFIADSSDFVGILNNGK
jgi:hypothetical protein